MFANGVAMIDLQVNGEPFLDFIPTPFKRQQYIGLRTWVKNPHKQDAYATRSAFGQGIPSVSKMSPL